MSRCGPSERLMRSLTSIIARNGTVTNQDNLTRERGNIQQHSLWVLVAASHTSDISPGCEQRIHAVERMGTPLKSSSGDCYIRGTVQQSG